MPRRKPDIVHEYRMSLGSWERERVEVIGSALSLGAVGLGIGAVALPIALLGGAVFAAILARDNIQEAINDFQDAINPNDAGGDEGRKTVKSELTRGRDELDGDSSEARYIQVCEWRKNERKRAFEEEHSIKSPDSIDDPKWATLWQEWTTKIRPLPPTLDLETGGAPGGVATGGTMYQTAIRATAARRSSNAQGNALTNPLGSLADLMGDGISKLAGTDYYLTPEKASGFISDPLLDLLAVRSISWTAWKTCGTSTYQGSIVGNEIELASMTEPDFTPELTWEPNPGAVGLTG